jgi:hypothetical protein
MAIIPLLITPAAETQRLGPSDDWNVSEESDRRKQQGANRIDMYRGVQAYSSLQTREVVAKSV